MTALSLYGSYDRNTIRSFFDPDAPFTRGSGLWGIAGIIPLKRSPGDFVFIVTLGKREGTYQFDEGISDEGILRWQSQPKQTTRSTSVAALMRHDDERNNVHLFLRPRASRAGVTLPYTYLGRLKYVSHDAERERPVHFAWQLIDWPIPRPIFRELGMTLRPEELGDVSQATEGLITSVLVEVARPDGAQQHGESTRSFRGRKVRYSSDEANRALGAKGERLALEHERRLLLEAGRPDLSARVEHVSLTKGDGLGYDILSFHSDGRDKFIEVKTTTGGCNSDFYISPNELAFSAAHRDSYQLIRIFGYDHITDTGSFFKLDGPVEEHCFLEATQHRASLKVVE